MDSKIFGIKKYLRALNYISASQIYLKDNFLLNRKLTHEDIKPRLLGHWGTCPGINFTYAHLNRLIKDTRAEMMFVLGPGHGFPAIQANLFVEGTLGKYYEKATQDEKGLGYIAREFSWPYGFPSHSNPGTPGVILEGGELGYSLSTSYGAILDNPDLIVACLIGDGEAETGPTATAWHINKFIDPAINGAVLPILHLNGYKISGPTIYGRMDDKELKNLFTGYGYEPIFVEYRDDEDRIHGEMISALDSAYRMIREIQNKARKENVIENNHFPMIVLRTPKGWTAPKKVGHDKIENNCLSHQVVAKEAKTNDEELEIIENWLHSYNFRELFDAQKGFIDEIKELVPDEGFKMGDSKHAMGGEKVFKTLLLPSVEEFAEPARYPGEIGSSSMIRSGEYLNKVFKLNSLSRNFRLMSPDETYSNKLHKVFDATKRAFVWPTKEWDKDISRDGRVIEMLSEHTLQGLIQGYVLTGRHAIFASYEAFIQIVGSMVDQYAKFIRVAREFDWRGDTPSLNFILTSSGWRQEHNGFSHQNPGFIDDVLQRQGAFSNVYFPADGTTTLYSLEKMLSSKNGINVLCAGKTVEPRWLNLAEAKKQTEDGVMIWNFASDENPDIVISGIGDYVSKEALAAVSIIKSEAPEIKVRFVNISALNPTGLGPTEKTLSDADFVRYFTSNKKVIFNFHGYPQTLKQILFDYYDVNPRFSVHGYVETGSTTTLFDMHVRNKTSRYHLAIETFETAVRDGVLDGIKGANLIDKYKTKLIELREYITKHGVDPDEIENWVWQQK